MENFEQTEMPRNSPSIFSTGVDPEGTGTGPHNTSRWRQVPTIRVDDTNIDAPQSLVCCHVTVV